MAVALNNVSDDWKRVAYQTLEEVAAHHSTLTVNDLYEAGLPPPPGSKNVIGALFKMGEANGLIKGTGTIARAARPQSNARNVLVWQSLRYRTAA